ncbi:MAG: GDCCVxC domain-containing (seleno)protein [Pseudolabrys sp.]
MGMPAMIVRPSSMVTKTSNITCPKCGYQAVEQMPTDACEYFYVCKGCEQSPPSVRLTPTCAPASI